MVQKLDDGGLTKVGRVTTIGDFRPPTKFEAAWISAQIVVGKIQAWWARSRPAQLSLGGGARRCAKIGSAYLLQHIPPLNICDDLGRRCDCSTLWGQMPPAAPCPPAGRRPFIYLPFS